MKNKLLKFNNITIEDNDPAKIFYPFRQLLQNNDFEKIISSNINFEYLFLINNSIKTRDSNFLYSQMGLKNTYYLFQELETTLHFIINGIFENSDFAKNIKNLLTKIRLALQDFMFALELKCYYFGFAEFRIIIEGILWISYIHKHINDIDNINNIFKNNKLNNKYKILFKEYCPDLYEIWSFCSKIIHTNIDFNLNINIIYKNNNSKDALITFSELLKSISTKICDITLYIFDIFEENIYISRYIKILNLNKEFRNNNKIIDEVNYDLTYFDLSIFQLEVNKKNLQEILNENYSNNNISYSELNEIIFNYSIGLIQHKKIQSDNLNYNYYSDITIFQNEINNLTNKFYRKIKDNLILYLNCLTLDHQIYISSQNNIINELQLIIIVASIFLLEIKTKNKKFAELKAILEDFLFMLYASKGVSFNILNVIIEFIKHNFNINIDEEYLEYYKNTIIPMKHFRPNDNIIYKSINESKNIGNRNIDDYNNIFKIIFNTLFKLINKNEYKDIMNNYDQMFKEIDYILRLYICYIYCTSNNDEFKSYIKDWWLNLFNINIELYLKDIDINEIIKMFRNYNL